MGTRYRSQQQLQTANANVYTVDLDEIPDDITEVALQLRSERECKSRRRQTRWSEDSKQPTFPVDNGKSNSVCTRSQASRRHVTSDCVHSRSVSGDNRSSNEPNKSSATADNGRSKSSCYSAVEGSRRATEPGHSGYKYISYEAALKNKSVSGSGRLYDEHKQRHVGSDNRKSRSDSRGNATASAPKQENSSRNVVHRYNTRSNAALDQSCTQLQADIDSLMEEYNKSSSDNTVSKIIDCAVQLEEQNRSKNNNDTVAVQDMQDVFFNYTRRNNIRINFKPLPDGTTKYSVTEKVEHHRRVKPLTDDDMNHVPEMNTAGDYPNGVTDLNMMQQPSQTSSGLEVCYNNQQESGISHVVPLTNQCCAYNPSSTNINSDISTVGFQPPLPSPALHKLENGGYGVLQGNQDLYKILQGSMQGGEPQLRLYTNFGQEWHTPLVTPEMSLNLYNYFPLVPQPQPYCYNNVVQPLMLEPPPPVSNNNITQSQMFQQPLSYSNTVSQPLSQYYKNNTAQALNYQHPWQTSNIKSESQTSLPCLKNSTQLPMLPPPPKYHDNTTIPQSSSTKGKKKTRQFVASQQPLLAACDSYVNNNYVTQPQMSCQPITADYNNILQAATSQQLPQEYYSYNNNNNNISKLNTSVRPPVYNNNIIQPLLSQASSEDSKNIMQYSQPPAGYNFNNNIIMPQSLTYQPPTPSYNNMAQSLTPVYSQNVTQPQAYQLLPCQQAQDSLDDFNAPELQLLNDTVDNIIKNESYW